MCIRDRQSTWEDVFVGLLHVLAHTQLNDVMEIVMMAKKSEQLVDNMKNLFERGDRTEGQWCFEGDKGREPLPQEYQRLFNKMRAIGLTEVYYTRPINSNQPRYRVDPGQRLIFDSSGKAPQSITIDALCSNREDFKRAYNWLLANANQIGNDHLVDVYMAGDNPSFFTLKADLKAFSQTNLETKKVRNLYSPDTRVGGSVSWNDVSPYVELRFPSEKYQKDAPMRGYRIEGVKKDVNTAIIDLRKLGDESRGSGCVIFQFLLFTVYVVVPQSLHSNNSCLLYTSPSPRDQA
eukprot:TRINITY_DN9298_c0_g1_i1.p1 TRINITY_DN9298_c0_g1~~TRINITY_DN9298_c0_g1_i1.p1  ORF type:complete len:292 (+),score=34.55 TRINITY_DN9298_c0_g1_i1:64-939(+)